MFKTLCVICVIVKCLYVSVVAVQPLAEDKNSQHILSVVPRIEDRE